MEPGNIVEFIDRQKIVCAVVLEIKNQRLRLLTETDRELKLSANRLLNKAKKRIGLSIGRFNLVNRLVETVKKRNTLIDKVNVQELWEILHEEQEWIDIGTMTEFCFNSTQNKSPEDYESAVIRAFFNDRLYFKFNNSSFFPYSEKQVEQNIAKKREDNRRKQLVEKGGSWLKKALSDKSVDLAGDGQEYAEILKSYYLYEKESKYYTDAVDMLARAGINSHRELFEVLVKLGILQENENIDLYRYNIAASFPEHIIKKTESLAELLSPDALSKNRVDLTGLNIITIDGRSTLDFDDALSIENFGDHYRLGVHIIDVGYYVKKKDIFNNEAFDRGSSIYMPDLKIPMLPPFLTEDICSLKAGSLRPAISIMIQLSRSFEITGYEIIPSIIKVMQNFSYFDVNLISQEDPGILTLINIAEEFRRYRLAAGAINIFLPEINIWIDKKEEIIVKKIDRESPARMLVAEIMIMANWLMARFLMEHKIPAIYRSQPEPKERLNKNGQGTIFQNCMQRRLLSRFILGSSHEHHSGLGLNAYVTATSPIRKYYDLVTQRQIRAVLGMETAYEKNEIDKIIQMLTQTMADVVKIQRNRNRYWLLKHLEKKRGEKFEAIVLFKRRNNYQILIADYMLECDLSISSCQGLNPEEVIHVTIQHVDARQDVISILLS